MCLMAIPINSAFLLEFLWEDQQGDRKHLGREKTEWQLEVLASLLVCLRGVKLHIPTDIKHIKPRARPCAQPLKPGKRSEPRPTLSPSPAHHSHASEFPGKTMMLLFQFLPTRARRGISRSPHTPRTPPPRISGQRRVRQSPGVVSTPSWRSGEGP